MLTLEELEKIGFRIDKENKFSVKLLNYEKSVAIFVEKDRSVWLSVDGLKVKTTITTIDELKQFENFFENHKILLPF